MGTNERNESKSEREEGDPQRLVEALRRTHAVFALTIFMSESVYSTKLPLLSKTQG